MQSQTDGSDRANHNNARSKLMGGQSVLGRRDMRYAILLSTDVSVDVNSLS